MGNRIELAGRELNTNFSDIIKAFDTIYTKIDFLQKKNMWSYVIECNGVN